VWRKTFICKYAGSVDLFDEYFLFLSRSGRFNIGAMNETLEGIPAVLAAVRKRIAADGAISFAEFSRIALYHPEGGYYRAAKRRVGTGAETDFITATSTGHVFSDLLLEAARQLVAPEETSAYAWVEIGAETGAAVALPGAAFREQKALSLGHAFEIPRRSIVFSNELFDAQPFHRLVFRSGEWREVRVAWREKLVETDSLPLSPEVEAVLPQLPRSPGEGYRLDLPLESVSLLRDIGKRKWEGLFIAFDYGKCWEELISATPQGTARAYYRHRQSNDLLARPGEQDLTCHVCWDWLESGLREAGFREIQLFSQEAFFVTHATAAIERIVTVRPGQMDPRRQRLHQLIFPGHMGQKFQVLMARR
jgi:SAM-dependent MidA family methyltransferase